MANKDRSQSTSLVMRKRYGAMLREMRQEAGLTQQEVAAHLGYDYYTMVSQIERGLGRIPPEDLPVWASLYRKDPKEFAKLALYWTDPYVYAAIWGVNPIDEQKLPHIRTTNEKRSTSGSAGRGRRA